jgi:hypothetical protein
MKTGAASFLGAARQPEIIVGLLASPGPAADLTESLLPEIDDRLPQRLPGCGGGLNSSPTGWSSRRPA